MVTLENQYLRVRVNPLGAELDSLFDKTDGVEHMWDANPNFWGRKAPILFPSVGESKDGKIKVGSTDFPMGRHGFVRNQQFIVSMHNNHMVELQLKENEQTLASYPFKFLLTVRYELDGTKLRQLFSVKNTGFDRLGFQLGGHPAFSVPFGGIGSYSDYYIQFDRPLSAERHLLNDKGLYNGETHLVLDNSDTIPLSYELFNEDALVFKNIESKSVWIQHKDGGKKLTVKYDGFPHLGIWSVPGADYVCIEPWIGCADRFDQREDFFKKENIVCLEQGESFKTSFNVSLEKQTA